MHGLSAKGQGIFSPSGIVTRPDDPAPHSEVVINNLGDNKLHYYLEREIEYAADGCNGDMRMSTVTFQLENTISDASALPEYVRALKDALAESRFKYPAAPC